MINKYSKYINLFLIKTLICIFLFLCFLICNKSIKNFKYNIYENIYNSNFSFAKTNKIIENYFGELFPISKVDEIQVFSESLIYKSKDKYKDGVLLKVDNNYIVPAINSGIVIYIGKKEEYGMTIIIEDEDEIDYWYSNINIGNIKMYEYISKGDFLGEVIGNNLIMKIEKKGKILDYNQYV